jgi:hypothetical protein
MNPWHFNPFAHSKGPSPRRSRDNDDPARGRQAYGNWEDLIGIACTAHDHRIECPGTPGVDLLGPGVDDPGAFQAELANHGGEERRAALP